MKSIIGQAVPQECPDCGLLLPSKHALAAHLHRMHGRVALCTQYTSGPICLWCLGDFHNTDRLRYHLLHSPLCEHGLRCVVGPVYTYGSGSKRRGRRGHLRAPVGRVPGPINASPAQRKAALEGRICTDAELAEELDRLAPGPSFSSSARSSQVMPRAAPSDRPPSSSLSRSPANPSGGFAALRSPRQSRPAGGALWGSFADFAGSCLRSYGIARSPGESGAFLPSGTLAWICALRSLRMFLGRQVCGARLPSSAEKLAPAPSDLGPSLLPRPLLYAACFFSVS